MGNKLVAMVKYLFFCIILTLNISSNDDILNKNQSLNKLHVDFTTENAKIFQIIGDGSDFKLKNTYVGKPKRRDLKKIGLVTKRDKYVIKFFDENDKLIIEMGIGDPFTAYAQHIGYEDSKRFAFQLSDQDIHAPIPVNITPKKLSIEKRVSENSFKLITLIPLDIQ